jgi:hypothetical protein
VVQKVGLVTNLGLGPSYMCVFVFEDSRKTVTETVWCVNLGIVSLIALPLCRLYGDLRKYARTR